MNKLLSRLCLLTVLITAPPGMAWAQEDTQWYEVEVLIFRQWQAGGAEDAELTPADPPPPYFERIAALADAGAEPGTPFRLLPPQRLTLQGAWQRLAESGPYEPLVHLGWEQPAYEEAGAVAVALPTGWMPPVMNEPLAGEARGGGSAEPASGQAVAEQDPAPMLEIRRSAYLHQAPNFHGLLRVHVGRLIHLRTDLRLAQPGPGGELTAEVMRQHASMRSGELHYLDHPRLGLLVRFTPMESAPGASAEAASVGTAESLDGPIEEETLPPGN
ncbi:CsiV family protein [Alkalilimnicola sp. S0819]|uniref:CsiV family protein n=1 Tax=Alkalilimnicola sp. S0819 TaxID=2613922 RepID=UPI001261CD7B|nr:CsiV family protein [Alkalilimnicola sp. S0819]KAB7627640.1 hypothetical protein F3N43_04070 [Alkalilimnicola sp. S0819]MPQ15805.1 hypothetical protein [Alkalilimnicola sp. S0819]